MAYPEIHVLVCTNQRGTIEQPSQRPSCGFRGGLEVYRAFKDAVRSSGLKHTILATRTGCLRHCTTGVTVVCVPANLWLGRLEPQDVEPLLAAVADSPDAQTLAGRLSANGLASKLLSKEAPWE